MSELIEIKEVNGKKIVSARELHKFLEVKNHFTQWINDNIIQFDQDIDYKATKVYIPHLNKIGGTERVDYALTLDTAKEMAMLSRVVKGKIARQYFIACEKELMSKQIALPQNYAEALRQLADSTEREEKALLELNQANTTIKENKSKVVFANSVSGCDNSILIRQFAKDLSDDTFKIGQNQLFDWLRSNNYLNSSNEPFQHYVNQGLFEVITRTIGNTDSNIQVKTTKITGKGAIYFAKKIKHFV